MKPTITAPLDKKGEPIIRLQYKGQSVILSKQLCKSFGCTRMNVTNTLRYHEDEFTEGVDYFKIDGDEMVNFKKDSRRIYSDYLLKRCGCGSSEELFSQRNLQGETIPNEYSMMTLSYFTKLASEQEQILEIELPKIEEPEKDKLKNPAEIQSESAEFSPREKVDRLIKMAELTTDENLRNDLIRRAAALI